SCCCCDLTSCQCFALLLPKPVQERWQFACQYAALTTTERHAGQVAAHHMRIQDGLADADTPRRLLNRDRERRYHRLMLHPISRPRRILLSYASCLLPCHLLHSTPSAMTVYRVCLPASVTRWTAHLSFVYVMTHT